MKYGMVWYKYIYCVSKRHIKNDYTYCVQK